MPLRTPHRTSYGTTSVRRVVLVGLEQAGRTSWGECPTFDEPTYTDEYSDAAFEVLQRFLLPPLTSADLTQPVANTMALLGHVRGHRMAKAAVEAALVGAILVDSGSNAAVHFGATQSTVASTAVLGTSDSAPETSAAIKARLDQGFTSVKVKVSPESITRTVIALTEIRRLYPDTIQLAVDANGSFRWEERGLLRQLADVGVAYVEQPFAADDLVGHARLTEDITTPICLDESIESVGDAATALALGAASVINIKPSRVGGLGPAVEIGALCADMGASAFCGGMLETGVGRAAALSIATGVGLVGPTDLGPSANYFAHDICPPIDLVEGRIAVPTGVGFGTEIDQAALDAATTETATIETPAVD